MGVALKRPSAPLACVRVKHGNVGQLDEGEGARRVAGARRRRVGAQFEDRELEGDTDQAFPNGNRSGLKRRIRAALQQRCMEMKQHRELLER